MGRTAGHQTYFAGVDANWARPRAVLVVKYGAPSFTLPAHRAPPAAHLRRILTQILPFYIIAFFVRDLTLL